MTDAGPRQVRRVAAAVILRAGCVLVQTRAAPGRWQGYWEFPGGGVEPGEDLAACVVRECEEELGLAVRPGATLHDVRWGYGDVEVAVTFLLCELVTPAEPTPRQDQQWRWATADELPNLRFLPANAEVVRRVAGLLGG